MIECYAVQHEFTNVMSRSYVATLQQAEWKKCFRQKLTLGVMNLCAAIKGCMSKFLETLLFGLQHEQSLCGLSIFWLNFLEIIQRREPLSVRTVACFMMYMTSDVEHPIIIFSL